MNVMPGTRPHGQHRYVRDIHTQIAPIRQPPNPPTAQSANRTIRQPHDPPTARSANRTIRQPHDTPTALHSIAQGRGVAAHPGAPIPNCGDYPNGVGQRRMMIVGTCRIGERDDMNRYQTVHSCNYAVVKPRWGLDVAMGCRPRVRRVPRRPWAMECNAVGVKTNT